MPKLKRVECLGGPLDGKWVTMREDTTQFFVNINVLVHHLYVMDEQQTGKGVRTVYRHARVGGTVIERDK